MRYALLIIAAAAAIVAAPAYAAGEQTTPDGGGLPPCCSPLGSWGPYTSSETWTTTYDSLGRVVSTWTSGAQALDATADPEPTTWMLVGSATGAVCKDIDQLDRRSDWFGLVTMYEFHVTAHWCWKSNAITSLVFGASTSHMRDTTYQGVVSNYGWYYQLNGSARGGRYQFTQGREDNCVFKYGCVASDYPWIKLWLNGGGAWKVRKGIS